MSTTRAVVLGAVVTTATVTSVFFLPFLFPPAFAYSQSYVVGFNNRMATALVLLISICVCVYALRRKGSSESVVRSSAGRPLPLGYLLLTGSAVTAWVGCISKLILRHTSRAVEDFTLIPQMQKNFYFHRALYSQVEFAYGPLLFHPTLWLARLLSFYNGPVDLAYYITLLVHHLLGLAMLFYVVNRLPLTHGSRATLFGAISLYAFNPLMGLNYTLLRFMLPLFCTVLISRVRGLPQTVLMACICAMLLAGTSAELAPPFLLGVGVMCCLWSMQGQSRTPWVFAGAVISAALVLLALPREYLRAIQAFSHGYNNLVLLPKPEMLLVLFCAVWLAPFLLARQRRAETYPTVMLAGLYAVSLGMLPAVLGSAEILHVLSNGLGFLLLGAVALSGRRWPSVAFAGALAALQLLMLAEFSKEAKVRLFTAVSCGDPQHRLVAATAWLPQRLSVVARNAESIACPAYMPLETLESFTHGEPFVMPWVTDANTSERLALAPEYRPSYFHGMINVATPDMQRAKVAEMRQVNWAVVYDGDHPHPLPTNLPLAVGVPTWFHSRHQVSPDEWMTDELNRHWIPVATLGPGPTILYHRQQ